jgi:hypothetical protein
MRHLIPFGLLVTSCGFGYANSNFVSTNVAPFPVDPISPDQVMVVSTPPARPFVEIGFIDGEASQAYGGAPESAVGAMRVVAARHGCDALLVTGPNNYGRGAEITMETAAGYHAACLVFTDKPRVARAAPPPRAPPGQRTFLFRSAVGTVYRVAPESRDAALRAGWTPIGTE